MHQSERNIEIYYFWSMNVPKAINQHTRGYINDHVNKNKKIGKSIKNIKKIFKQTHVQTK